MQGNQLDGKEDMRRKIWCNTEPSSSDRGAGREEWKMITGGKRVKVPWACLAVVSAQLFP